MSELIRTLLKKELAETWEKAHMTENLANQFGYTFVVNGKTLSETSGELRVYIQKLKDELNRSTLVS